MKRIAWFLCPFTAGAIGLLKLVPVTKPPQQAFYVFVILFLTLAYGCFQFRRWRGWRRDEAIRSDGLDNEAIFERVWPQIDEDLREEFRRIQIPKSSL